MSPNFVMPRKSIAQEKTEQVSQNNWKCYILWSYHGTCLVASDKNNVQPFVLTGNRF